MLHVFSLLGVKILSGIRLVGSLVATVIGDLFDGLESTLTEVTAFMINLFNGVVKIFWDSTSTEINKLTVIGWLSIVGLTFGLFWLGFKMIRRLIHLRG